MRAPLRNPPVARRVGASRAPLFVAPFAEPAAADTPAVVEHRVVFDFAIAFSNGGGLQGQDFRLDIPTDDIGDDELAALIVADLRLLMVGDVRILHKRIVVEAHKRNGDGFVGQG
jgi:hypothetical protein